MTRSRTPLAALAATLLLWAAPAAALTIDDTLPLFFDGPGGFGFSDSAVVGAGLAPNFTAEAVSVSWLSAGPPGSGAGLEIEQALETVQQRPDVPTPENPIIVDSRWTVTNMGPAPLASPRVVFTTIDPAQIFPLVELVGLDATLLDLVAYSFEGTDYLFGSAPLPPLGPGESGVIQVRYIAGTPLPGTDPLTLPALGVSVLEGAIAIPEPTTLALWLTAALAAGLAGRRAGHTAG